MTVPLAPARGELTVRESEVLDAYAELWSSRAVAARLGISVHTVRHHLDAIREKYDVGSIGQAVMIRNARSV